MGLVSGDVAFSAYQGTDEFSGHPVESLRAIGAVYSSLSTWMAPESEHISYVHELAGHHIAVGPEGSTRSFPPAPLSRQPGSILPTLP